MGHRPPEATKFQESKLPKGLSAMVSYVKKLRYGLRKRPNIRINMVLVVVDKVKYDRNNLQRLWGLGSDSK